MKRFLSMLLMVMLLSPLTMKADEILVGTATGHSNLGPFVNSYPHSWIEMIYTAEEIGQACTIGSIAYQYAEGPKFPANEIKIYLAETTKSAFESKADWTPESELTLVYSGVNVVIGGDEEWEVFELDTPFEYSGEKNLAVVISKTADYKELYLRWSCYEAAKNILFTASDTDPSFAQYPTAEGLATYDKKPIMRLGEKQEVTKLAAPTNLRAAIRQDVPGYNYKFEITMMWDAVEGAKGYDVYVNTDTQKDFYFGYTNGTAYVAGSNQETTFEFYVVAFNDDPAADSDPSEVYTVTIVDDAVEELTSSFNIYPNPVNDRLFIETEVDVENIVVCDIFGRQQLAVSGQSSAVSVADLNSGVYFVMIKTTEGEVVKRFIKK